MFINITQPTTQTQSSPTLAKVNDIRTSSNQVIQQLFNRWRGNMLRFWQDPNPQALLDAWQQTYPGEPASAFQANAQTVVFLEQIHSGCTTETMLIVKPFTINSDGSVTIAIQ